MGASASKGAKAAGSAARKYPTRPPPTSTTRPPVASAFPAGNVANNAPGPTVHPQAQATETKTAAIEQDARDPAFASRLSSLGAVQPNPHYSPTSTSEFDPRRSPSSALQSDMMQAPPPSAFPDPRINPVLRVLEARQRITDEAEDELKDIGRRGFAGRKYVDASTIQLALMRHARGEPISRIEESLGIKPGRLGMLGKGTTGAVNLAEAE